MNVIAEKLAEEALALPDNERAALIEILLRSMNPPARKEIDRLWAEEAERRVKEIEDGAVTLLDGDEVFLEVRKRLRR